MSEFSQEPRRRISHELSEVFTVIAHLADASAQVAQRRRDSDGDRVAAWSAQIGEHVTRGQAIVKRLVEQESHGG